MTCAQIFTDHRPPPFSASSNTLYRSRPIVCCIGDQMPPPTSPESSPPFALCLVLHPWQKHLQNYHGQRFGPSFRSRAQLGALAHSCGHQHMRQDCSPPPNLACCCHPPQLSSATAVVRRRRTSAARPPSYLKILIVALCGRCRSSVAEPRCRHCHPSADGAANYHL